jgi:endogenous inhibitor of DNA gyrase (YacG/DUF329 family)
MSKLLRLKCPVCNKQFNRYASQAKAKSVCCSKKCYAINMESSMKGENNPNFNNRWSEQQKKKQSKLMRSKVTDELRYKYGTANRGKKFSQERIESMHKHRDKKSYSRPHTKKSKTLIGIKSKQKWENPEYLQKYRQTMENNGYWIPLCEKSDFEIYYQEADWIERMFDLILCKKQLRLLKKYGIFHNKNNISGVVRDHMLSRRTGFNLGIFPQILRHPANCQILTAKDNIKKKNGRYIDADHLTIEELFDKIESYAGNWAEQELCTTLISAYKAGQRYERKNNK